MGLLDGKKILITGVLTDASLAFGVARLAQEQGAEIVLTGAGRGLRLTQRTARKLPSEPDVFEFDVTDAGHAVALRATLEEKWGRVDGALHSIGFAPEACLGDDFLGAGWDDVKVALEISAYSLKVLADATAPLMTDGGSLVGLTFDATVAWPAYNWMGVAKAALESTNRYLARELGPRGSAATSSRPGPSAPWRPSRSPASPSSRTCGTSGPRSVGTSTTRRPSRRPPSRCCRTGSGARPGR